MLLQYLDIIFITYTLKKATGSFKTSTSFTTFDRSRRLPVICRTGPIGDIIHIVTTAAAAAAAAASQFRVTGRLMNCRNLEGSDCSLAQSWNLPPVTDDSQPGASLL